MKKYRIIYTFNHSTMGFQNSVTVFNINVDYAIEQAKFEVEKTFGKKMIQRFSFKPDPCMNGVVIS